MHGNQIIEVSFMDIYDFGKGLIVEAGSFIEKRMLESFHIDLSLIHI